jgi:hypothetical protein
MNPNTTTDFAQEDQDFDCFPKVAEIFLAVDEIKLQTLSSIAALSRSAMIASKSALSSVVSGSSPGCNHRAIANSTSRNFRNKST